MASPTARMGLSDASGFWNTIWMSFSTARWRLARGARQTASVHPDVSAGGGRQTDDGPGHRGLAAAALADDAQGLAFVHGQADPIHGPHRAVRAPPGEETRGRSLEEGLGVVDLDQRRRPPGRPPPPPPRPRWPRADTRRAAARSANGGTRSGGPFSTSCSGGRAARQASSTNRQRGAKTQPSGSSSRRGIEPGMVTSERLTGEVSKRGTHPSRSRVYGCSGRLNSVAQRAPAP